MDFHQATQSYETWLAEFGPLFDADLQYKHDMMRKRDDPFPFFRGTYYRWPFLWRTHCPELQDAPRVLAIGDLHIENFGIWRDHDSRLCWGVNDFDEFDQIPYTNDLVRLAASIRVAQVGANLDVTSKQASAALLTGYRANLERGGDPFVLEERHPELRRLAQTKDSPVKFWDKIDRSFTQPWPEGISETLPKAAKAALRKDFPEGVELDYRPRLKVGMGSLGKPRFMARALIAGGWMSREVKRVTPPATAWDSGISTPTRIAEALTRAIRSPDPHYRPGPTWLTRRIAPKSIRMDLERLLTSDDLETVLHAMGAETANIHLGTPDAAAKILPHLDALPKDWLRTSSKRLSLAVLDDWRSWSG